MRRSLHATPLWELLRKVSRGETETCFLGLSLFYCKSVNLVFNPLKFLFPHSRALQKFFCVLLYFSVSSLGTHFLLETFYHFLLVSVVLKLCLVIGLGHPWSPSKHTERSSNTRHCQGPPATASQNRSSRHIQCYIQAAGAKCDQMWTGCLPRTRDGECNPYGDHELVMASDDFSDVRVFFVPPAINRPLHVPLRCIHL